MSEKCICGHDKHNHNYTLGCMIYTSLNEEEHTINIPLIPTKLA